MLTRFNFGTLLVAPPVSSLLPVLLLFILLTPSTRISYLLTLTLSHSHTHAFLTLFLALCLILVLP